MTLSVEAGPRVNATTVAKAPIVLTSQVPWSDTSPMNQIKQDFGSEPLSFIALFVSPRADFEEVVAEAHRLFPDTDVAACTTAGEISKLGYDEGKIIAVGFPTAGFATTSLLIEDIHDLNPLPLIDRITLERVRLQERNPDLNSNFAFLVVDGMSLSEDALTATISPALREMPLFGGSAGDGTDFRRALVALNGKVAVSAAVLTLVRSRYRTQVFSLDHLIPSEEQMVVTEADPERRIVKSINAEPAAREYARIVGKDPDQLDRFTFASHPVVVRIGAAHHVRAIQQVNDAGELVFFSAIDEGMVLTVASPQNMVDHLHNKMADLSDQDKPAHILGCDCILRRIEAEQRQMTRDLSNVMASYNVTGFSTYGEQIGPLHVNHTMSGVAIYAAED
ncbi:FIST N-terminal domain-containing protein [Sulfitobacter pacificus]|uniref:FIST N-terminal domain-containing protein n=1 Tax=Sulfitobacter pacificus TaxID=1499314 RepID=UPI00310744ED